MLVLTAALAGLVFGIGLIVSGMANPAKVQAFLDLAGAWDPSLALVMIGALAVTAIAFAAVRGRTASLAGAPMQVPATRTIDRRLVLGSLAFGIGWGIAGFCPGPAVVAVGMGQWKAGLFMLAMLAGMGAYEWRERFGQAAGGQMAAPASTTPPPERAEA
jgi:uncharacterized membrane protein YedE/YeeE